MRDAQFILAFLIDHQGLVCSAYLFVYNWFQERLLEKKRTKVHTTILKGLIQHTSQPRNQIATSPIMVVVLITGVCGSGKTTVARALAKKLSCPYVDADTFHSEENITKMKQGIALTDEDRQPWLLALHKVIERWSKRSESGVLACSALKEQYRQTILFGAEASSNNTPYCSNGDKRQKLSKPSPFYCLVVLLKGSKDVVRERMEKRQEHHMPLSLLASQFETLEEPVTCDEYSALHISVDQTVEEIINDILRTLKAKCGMKVSIHSTV